ncbi:MAG: DUF2062 domain-containing protein [Paracoccaceae bacterium]
MFRRRDSRPVLRAFAEALWPRGGWGRAASYLRFRLQRLPDTPEKISRGIAAGVFAAFTPFYGVHFFVAALLAWAMRGNVVAALTGTFFGNPLTYVPIAVVALETGYFILGERPLHGWQRDIFGAFRDAGADLWHNAGAAFTAERADWTGLAKFWDTVFLPYLVGGIVPGIVCAAVCYALSVPLVAAYQTSRRKRLRARLDSLHREE